MTLKQQYNQLRKQLDKLRKQLHKEEKDILLSKMAHKYVGKYFSKKYSNNYTTYFHVLSVGVVEDSYPVIPKFMATAIHVSEDNIGYDSRDNAYENDFQTEITKQAYNVIKQKLKDSIV